MNCYINSFSFPFTSVVMDLRFCHPTTGLLVGGTGAGKTYFMKRLIENRHLMFNVQFDRIVWHFTEWQSIYADLKQECGVEFYEGVPTLDEFPSDHGPLLLVIDDCMDQLANPEILKFFIKGAHHRNLSVFFLSQCLFPKGLRQISLNCSVCVIFKTSRDLAQIRSFCMQVNPSDWRALLEAYQDATVAPHSYLLFDFSYKQSDHMRLRACIFPGENTVVYIPKKQYKSGVTRELPLVADRHGHE